MQLARWGFQDLALVQGLQALTVGLQKLHETSLNAGIFHCRSLSHSTNTCLLCAKPCAATEQAGNLIQGEQGGWELSTPSGHLHLSLGHQGIREG